MPETDQTDSNQQKEGDKKKQVFDPGMKRIFGWGLVALAALLVFTFVQRAGRIPFFTENFLSLVILVIIAIQAYIYSRQWEVMERQGDAMQKGLERTDKVIENMDAQLVHMELQHVTNQGQIMIAATAAEASERSAKAAENSVNVARQSMIYAQRAYVMVEGGSVRIVENNALFSLKIVNFGNTPANDVRIFAVAEVRPSPPPVIDMRSATWTMAGVVAPHAEVKRFVATKEDIRPAQSDLMEKGKLGLYVWGAIEYRDVFPDSDPHQTKFSFSQRFGSTDIGPCDSNNEAF